MMTTTISVIGKSLLVVKSGKGNRSLTNTFKVVSCNAPLAFLDSESRIVTGPIKRTHSITYYAAHGD